MPKIRVAHLPNAKDAETLAQQLNREELEEGREIVGVGLDDTRNRNFIEFKSNRSSDKLERLGVVAVPKAAQDDQDAFRQFITPLMGTNELLERPIVMLSGSQVQVVVLRTIEVEPNLTAARLPTIVAGQAIVPKSILVRASMKRIICHWSVGNYKANDVDKNAYHVLIEGDGTVLKGAHKISDNESTADGHYAAHTKGTNTGSIGVSCCCMVGCRERPFTPGSQPMTKSQWDVMTQVVGELCHFYDIKISAKTVLGHGEVQETLGVKQNGKWDPMVWPWDPSKTAKQVGTALRAQVTAALDALTVANPQ